ncbi:MAG TPA: GNAT family N-acetyltransferase [Fimbriimonadaceae bacterium]|jgi:GNAT superfamily N-acetyltransferase
MILIASVLLASALAKQNPNGPCVTLPPSWDVNYSDTEHGRLAKLVAPDGLNIFFRWYDNTGAVAAVLRERDLRSSFFLAVIGERSVDVSLSPSGDFAASYQQSSNKWNASFSAGDYWATVNTPELTAEALAVTLSRVDFWHNDRRPQRPFIPDVASKYAVQPTILGTFQVPHTYMRQVSPSLVEDVFAGDTHMHEPTILIRSQSLAEPSQPIAWSGRWDLLKKVLVVTSYSNGVLDVHMEGAETPHRVIGPYFETKQTTSLAVMFLIICCASYIQAFESSILPMKAKLLPASPEDVQEIIAFRQAISDRLAEQFGPGYWAARAGSEKQTLFEMRRSTLFIARENGQIVGSLALTTRKPWSVDISYFTSAKKPLYLTAMAVIPDLQRKGLGRSLLVQAQELARNWPADAIRLDAYDAPAGAGDFYAKRGFTEVGRTSYWGGRR